MEIQLKVLTAEMVAFEETKSRAKADLQAKEVKWKARELDFVLGHFCPSDRLRGHCISLVSLPEISQHSFPEP
jgi:hypothetical protein